MTRFTISADYLAYDSEFADPADRAKAYQTYEIHVTARCHAQHIWTETRLIGVTKTGAERLEAFCAEHKDARICLSVPNGPRLVGWETK